MVVEVAVVAVVASVVCAGVVSDVVVGNGGAGAFGKPGAAG